MNKKTVRIWIGILLVLTLGILVWRNNQKNPFFRDTMGDGIEQVDLDTVYLKGSKVEVHFSDVLLSNPKETRKLIVGEQKGTVSTKLTDRLIKQLDFDFLKKTQNVSYTGTGYFVVDLDKMTKDCIVQDEKAKTVTIRIDHAYLETVDIHPNDVIIDEVQEGLLARGNIKLSVADYNTIEKELRSRLEEKFNTAENGQMADDMALKMVKEIYEPIVKAMDSNYSVVVEFK